MASSAGLGGSKIVGGLAGLRWTSQPAWNYKEADRLQSSGYTYDTAGRTTGIPAGDSAQPGGGDIAMDYYANDMMHTSTQESRTATYNLDVAANRIRSWSDSGTAITPTNHYGDDTDAALWTQESATRYTRVINGISDSAGIYDSSTGTINWQILDLNGSIVATVAGTGALINSTHTYNELGQPTASTDTGTLRYGWQGQAQRAADTPGGNVLMGQRVYDPGTGRFLSNDPIYGGNANPYDYCAGDPINCTDTSGNFKFDWHGFKSVHHWYGNVNYASFTLHFTDNDMIRGEDGKFYFGTAGPILLTLLCKASVLCHLIFDTLGAFVLYALHKDDQWYDHKCNNNGMHYQLHVGYVTYFSTGIRPYTWQGQKYCGY
jgi:RHS repeat-associated protein